MNTIKRHIKKYWRTYMVLLTLLFTIENCSRLLKNERLMLEYIKEAEYIRGYNDGYTHGILEEKN